jgi:hypothetical protein
MDPGENIKDFPGHLSSWLPYFFQRIKVLASNEKASLIREALKANPPSLIFQAVSGSSDILSELAPSTSDRGGCRGFSGPFPPPL